MPPLASVKRNIVNALVDVAKAEKFPSVSRDSEGRLLEPNSGFTERAALPILCDEVSCNFSVDELHGRGLILQREGWLFALRMKFNSAVLLDNFIETLAMNPPIVSADQESGYPAYSLQLQSMEVDHPVQQGGATGTQVEFIFEAEEGRR